MNRPFAILKDLLPQREKPAAERRQPAPKKSGQERRKDPRPQAEGTVAAATAAAPVPATSTDAPRQPSRPGSHGQARGRRQPGRRPQAAPAPEAAPASPTPDLPATTSPDPEQARKAAERAAKQRALADEGLAALVASHPGLFDRQAPVPLAIGIHKPLLDAARDGQLSASVAAVRAAIGRWTSSRQYLAVMLDGAVRVNLAGEPEGTVTTEQASAAQTWLEKRKARFAGKPRGQAKGKAGGKGRNPKPAVSASTEPAPETPGAGPAPELPPSTESTPEG